MNMKRMRGICALVAVLAIPILGLFFHTGTGNLSVFGIDGLAVICPVGALEAMLGSKGIVLRGVLCIALTVALVLVFGLLPCVPYRPHVYHSHRRLAPVRLQRDHMGLSGVSRHLAAGSDALAEMVHAVLPGERSAVPCVFRQPALPSIGEPPALPARRRHRLSGMRECVSREAGSAQRFHPRVLEVRPVCKRLPGQGHHVSARKAICRKQI